MGLLHDPPEHRMKHPVLDARGVGGSPRGEPASGLPLQRLPVTLQPEPALMKYFALTSLAAGPFFLFALVPLYFKYRTLRYQVDDEGITMRWGVLFRREVSLTYARIQDIHLSSNFVERWLGLARIQVQTASGSSAAEMTIEGLHAVQHMRDFLYSRMRGSSMAGARTAAPAPGAWGEVEGGSTGAGGPGPGGTGDVAAALLETAAELRALRLALGDRRSDPGA
jgi:membrane protein YdbS with pleckstrin-like domain